MGTHEEAKLLVGEGELDDEPALGSCAVLAGDIPQHPTGLK